MIEKDSLHNELRFTLNQRQLSLLIAGLSHSLFLFLLADTF